MTKFLVLVLALAGSSLLTLGVHVPSQAAQPEARPGAASEALNATDRDFLKQVAKNLEFEQAAGKLAEERGDRDVVKSFGKKDTAFAERMTRVLEKLAEKKSVQLPTNMDSEQTATLARLKDLRGEAFDKAFVESAGSAHHFQVLEDFKRTAERSIDIDVRGFARSWLTQVNQRFTMVNSATSDIAPQALKPSPDTAPRRGNGPRTNMQSDEQGRAKE